MCRNYGEKFTALENGKHRHYTFSIAKATNREENKMFIVVITYKNGVTNKAKLPYARSEWAARMTFREYTTPHVGTAYARAELWHGDKLLAKAVS